MTSQYEDQILALICSCALDLNRKWSQCNKTTNVFTEKHAEWLQKEFILLTYMSLTSDTNAGHPKKFFNL